MYYGECSGVNTCTLFRILKSEEVITVKTDSGLIDYCKFQLGRPYWMGTFGQTASAAIYEFNKKRLPQFYTASDFPTQYGKRVHDSIGLIKGYLWSDTPNSAPKYCSEPCRTDHSADSLLAACDEKGTIDTLPELPGVLVFMPEHVGVYIGGGYVIEARGHAYGVVLTLLNGRGWRNWGKCPYINYTETESEEDNMVRYERLSDIPNDWGAQDIIRTLMNAQIIKGDGSDPVGNNDIIDLSKDQIRSLAFEYRGGAFDRALKAAGMKPVFDE